MSTSAIIRWSPLVSYFLFIATAFSVLAFPVMNAISQGHTSGLYLVVVFSCALVWQVFTVYHYHQSIVPWLLLAAYVFGPVVFYVSALS